MLALNDQINYLASNPGQPVFVQGEPGTGKRLVARGLHEGTHGTSADCRYLHGVWYRTAGSLRELRVVSEGGDSPDVLGNLNRGTLIVHEVSQLSIEVQRALVDWIESGQGRSSQRRLVATSSLPIQKLRGSPAFDAKLLAILSTTRLELLPLGDRGDDVLMLTRYFLERDTEVFHAKGLTLDSTLQQQVLAAPFLGNVSELEWFVQKSLIHGRWLTESLFPATSDDARKLEDSRSHIHLILKLGEMTLDQVEAHFVHEVLRLCKGSQSQAAHLLGLSRGALYRRLEKFPGPPGGAVVRRWRRRGRPAADRDVGAA